MTTGQLSMHLVSDLDQRWESQAQSQIDPAGIVLLDQIDLPVAMPAFQLLLACDCRDHIFEHLEAYQLLGPIFLGEAIHCAGPVLMDAGHQVGGYPDIDRTVPPAS